MQNPIYTLRYPTGASRLQQNDAMHCILMWGLSSPMIGSLHNNIRPPEMELNPLKTACGCQCGGVIKYSLFAMYVICDVYVLGPSTWKVHASPKVTFQTFSNSSGKHFFPKINKPAMFFPSHAAVFSAMNLCSSSVSVRSVKCVL